MVATSSPLPHAIRAAGRQRSAAAWRGVHPAAQERARKLVVRLVLLIYVLAIFEGSIRKWLLPQFSQYIFFIRDPFLLLAYVVATQHGLWPRHSLWFKGVLAMCGLGLLLLLLQSAIGGASDTRFILSVHGYRSYFLYLPLAFLVGAQFRQADLTRLYRLTLWLAIPIAVLVFLQFFSPTNAAINVGSSSDENLQFRGLTTTAERTRPMGTFASGAAQQQFVATAWAIVLALVISMGARRKVSLWLLVPAGAAVLLCVGLSGSRGTVLQCGLAVCFALLVGVLGRGGSLKGRAMAWTLGLLALCVVLYPLVLPEGYAAFAERWTAADKAESRTFTLGVFGRALFGLVDFIHLFDQVPLLGYGLGYGSNASITLKAEVDGVMPGFLAETDFTRHMVDLGPVLGMLYIAFRLALTTWLAAMVIRVTRLISDPMPLILLSYVAVVVSHGQVTGQGTINVYAWLFTGVLIAACNTAGLGQRRPSSGFAQTRAPQRFARQRKSMT